MNDINGSDGGLTPSKGDETQVCIESEQDEGQMRCSFGDDLRELKDSEEGGRGGGGGGCL